MQPFNLRGPSPQYHPHHQVNTEQAGKLRSELSEQEDSSSTRLMRLGEVLDRTALSRSSVYQLIADGSFPVPLKVGRASRWLEPEVSAWISKLMQERANANK